MKNFIPFKAKMIVLFFAIMSFGIANAQDVDIKVGFNPPGDPKTTNPVTVTLNGKIYDKGWWFDEVIAGKYTATEEERFLINVLEVNTKGKPDDVVNLFLPDERPDRKKFTNNPEMFERSQNFFKQIASSAFLAKINYGDYRIFIIQHSGDIIGERKKVYPIKISNGAFFLTNKLVDDPVYSYIAYKYKDQLQLKNR